MVRVALFFVRLLDNASQLICGVSPREAFVPTWGGVFMGYARGMRNFLNEFKAFAMRGNVLDLAIGVVIGGAFGQITNSLVTNIITPPIGLLIGGFDFSKLAFSLGGTASLGYGTFLQSILNFIIIAFALFLLIKVANRFVKKPEPTPAENMELKVLSEIRDLLKNKNA